MNIRILAAISAALISTSVSMADVIGLAVTNGSDNFLSFTQVDPDYAIAGDMFGIRSTLNPGVNGLPFAIEDAGNGVAGGDSQGIIRNQASPLNRDTAPFFGVVDTINSSGNEGLHTAFWTFDATNATSLSVSIDIAAMGDFEVANDTFLFDYRIDGGSYLPLFTVTIDESINQNYSLLAFNAVLDDPAKIGNTLLSNAFQTFSGSLTGTGSVLEVRFRGNTDGGTEAFAFRNITVEGTVVPEVGTLAMSGIVAGSLAIAGLVRRSKNARSN